MSSSARESAQITSVEDVVDVIRQQPDGAQSITAAREGSATSLRLDLRGLNRVVDYPARDMTVTVEAGMLLSDLTDLLASENQQLPVDVADPTMSVGAFVASDLAGPRQYGYGTLRDANSLQRSGAGASSGCLQCRCGGKAVAIEGC